MRLRPLAAFIHMLVVALCAAAASGNTFTNPIVPRGGDPWAFQFGGQYFYTSTTGGDVKVARSPWLQSLNSNARQVWNPPTDTPYGHNIWAPEIHRLNDKWYLYVAADDGADANHRMYVLEGDSQDPQGSYTLKGQISLPANRWAIDGTIFEHGEKDYFIWSDGMNLEFAAVDDAVFVPEPSVGAIVVLAGLFMRPGFRLAAQNSPSIRRSALEGVDFLSQGIRMADSGTGLRCVPSQRARGGL